mmetsp:Transcript_21758/g.43563  ORF Transcript_21758/g.43563 Transcript_21758/m.43563 type:complete len:82 (-) Transcript_21758:138-383(-)
MISLPHTTYQPIYLHDNLCTGKFLLQFFSTKSITTIDHIVLCRISILIVLSVTYQALQLQTLPESAIDNVPYKEQKDTYHQ